MICLSCGQTVKAGAGFCTACGAPASKGVRMCQNGHVQDAGWDSCPYCAQQGGGGGGRAPVRKTVLENVASAATPAGRRVTTFQAEAAGSTAPVEARRIAGWLVTFSWQPEGRDYRIYLGRNVLGADAARCDVVLQDPAASSEHAILLVRTGEVFLQDNLSTNGTRVNGQAIDRIELNDGDTIEIGSTALKLRLV